MVVVVFWFFFFNDTATSEIYTLSLHDALPIYDFCAECLQQTHLFLRHFVRHCEDALVAAQCRGDRRSEEHTSELQSHSDLVCRLLLEKKNNSGPKLIKTQAIAYMTPSDSGNYT